MDNTQQSILVGSILGDGHLDKLTRNGSRWIIKYDDRSLPYLKWLHSQLYSLGISEVKAKKGNYHQHYFHTKPSLKVGYWMNLFYPQGRKLIPENIKSLLISPLSLAVWYMDDGNLDFRNKYHFNSTFATFCFSYEECKLLANTLKENFGVEARVHKTTMRGKLYFRLYIPSKFMIKFVNLIKKYIHPCMKYKINS